MYSEAVTVCWSSALLQTASLKRGSTEACTDTDVVMLSDIICSEGEFRLSLKICFFKQVESVSKTV